MAGIFFCMGLNIVFLHPADAASLGPGFAPSGIVMVHEGMKPGAVVWLQQMAELVDHDMLYAPFWKQQQVAAEANSLGLNIARPPA